MCGSATLAMVMSRTCIRVASMTAMVTIARSNGSIESASGMADAGAAAVAIG
jgi:hypothetical protein